MLDIPTWEIEREQHCFLRGASGTGKSTLLNLIGGVLTPSGGSIEILDQPFSRLSNRKKDKFRAAHLGIVFQQFNLVPYLSVMENIQLSAYFTKQKSEQVEQKANELFARLKLSQGLFSQRADQLSVGQQQRVAIARALINSPEIIIADEPTSALDSDTRDSFMRLLIDVVNENKSTLIFVSHDKSLQQFFQHSIDLQHINKAGVSNVA